MMQIEKNYFAAHLPVLIPLALADGKISQLETEKIINSSRLRNGQSPISLNRQRIKTLRRTIDFRMTTTALNCGLYFRSPSTEIALISGAGIAGLAAAFELLNKGLKVIIAEKRPTFSRSNIINLNVEVQYFLKKFGLLKEFEESVAARINSHRCVHVGKNGSQELDLADVSQLNLGKVSFKHENLDQLFQQDGIYSVKIQDLQNFLAKKLLAAGAHLFGPVEVKVLARTTAGGVSKVQLSGKEGLYPINLQPNLFIIAEGAHSKTAEQLGMKNSVVANACSGENWIFGNVEYAGTESFVVSIIDTSDKILKIANVIFNGKIHQINIAVTPEAMLSQESLEKQILKIVELALHLEHRESTPHHLISVVAQPVHIENRKRPLYSKDNVFLIGDTAGCSSPLAGLGGTLGLTLIPYTIKQLLKDRKQLSKEIHPNFENYSEASISSWMKKSENVKKFCLSIFDKAQIPSQDKENVAERGEPT